MRAAPLLSILLPLLTLAAPPPRGPATPPPTTPPTSLGATGGPELAWLKAQAIQATPQSMAELVATHNALWLRAKQAIIRDARDFRAGQEAEAAHFRMIQEADLRYFETHAVDLPPETVVARRHQFLEAQHEEGRRFQKFQHATDEAFQAYQREKAEQIVAQKQANERWLRNIVFLPPPSPKSNL